MKAKLDYKKILLEHGERIGLIAAGAIAGLLLLLSLFWPGHGLFAGSPTEKAKVIEESSTLVETKLKDPNNLPTEADKPTKQAQQQLIAYKSEQVEADRYRTETWIPPNPNGANTGRRVPRVLAIAEGSAGANRINIRSYIFAGTDPVRIMALQKEGGGTGTATGGAQPGRPRLPGMGGRGMAGMGRGGLGMPGDAGGEGGGKDHKVLPIDLTELDKHPDLILAEQIRPVIMAVIAASFPYKKQVEEFRAKLGMRSNDDVLKDMSLEKDKYGNVLPAFRFLGVNVQRRELDGDGKPITPFKDVDVNEAYKPFIVLTGTRFEAEDPALAPVAFRGLVMGKLQQFSTDIKPADDKAAMPAPGPGRGPAAPETARVDPKKDKYPKVEKNLKLLAQTLEALKEKGAMAPPAAPGKFRADDFDSFAPPQETPATGTVGTPPPASGTGTPDPMAPAELPEYCLVRLIDVTVEAGKTYQYQVQVRMGNPNFGRRDVASTKYAEDKEMLSEWTMIPTPVTITPDLYYYAVDEKDLFDAEAKGRARYRGPYTTGQYAPGQYNKDQVLFMQAHRWLNTVKVKGGGAELIVGEWAAAERFPVRRGDYVGHREKIEVPYWKYSREAYTLAAVDVDFGIHASSSSQPEAILVDFDAGRHGYAREAGRPVTDVQAVEALLLNPDGKLILLEGINDAVDALREKHLRDIRTRINDVRTGKTAGPGKGPGFSDG